MIVSDLPQRGSIYSIAEDHVDPDLLFVGTEFGCYFSNDNGQHWIQLKNGLPTIAVRDIELQRRENDIVIATFGRGFYVLDDYSHLRNSKSLTIDKSAKIFPVRDALMYIQRTPIGLRDKGHLGSNYFTAENPTFGAQIRFYVKEENKKLKELRKEKEKAKLEKGEKIDYPSIEELRAEDQQSDPYLFVTISDENQQVIQHIKVPAKKGLNTVYWNLRSKLNSPINTRRSPEADELFGDFETGHLVMPGKYTAVISKNVDGVITQISDPISFNCKLLQQGKLQTKNMSENVAFYKKITETNRELGVVNNVFTKMKSEIQSMSSAALDIPSSPKMFVEPLNAMTKKVNALAIELYGDGTKKSREFETSPSVNDRLGTIEYALWNSSSSIPETYKESYQIAVKKLEQIKSQIKELQVEVKKIHGLMEDAKVPYIPGREIK